VAVKRATLSVWVVALACCPTSSQAIRQMRGATLRSHGLAGLPGSLLLKNARGGQSPVDDLIKKGEEIGKPVDDLIKRGEREIEKHLGKPLMNRINRMRAELCWTRPDLWNHKDCLEFLSIVCSKGTTGEGICGRFVDKLKDNCKDDLDAKHNKLFCDMAKKLKMARGEEDEEEKEQEQTQQEGPEEEEEEKAPAEKSSDQEGREQDNASGEGVGNKTDQAADQENTAGEEGNEEDTAPKGEENPDWDGDGIKNAEDKFPRDSTEWSDIDLDGVGDNKDVDRDGDGVVNVEDPFPNDPNKSGREDSDGDGVMDRDDAFPEDKSEWSDLDRDGIGDNSDDDRDGDGKRNDEDSHRNDASRWDDWDADGDGVFDKEDAFPHDASEWRDTDGDGVGDNADRYPNDPNCTADPCPAEDEASASDTTNTPSKFSKVERKLPEQGYDEHSPEEHVKHDDMYSWTGDWREEWPESSESEHESIVRICKEHPKNVWCTKYKREFAQD